MTTTVVINGAAAEAAQVVAIADRRRKYIGLYSKTGTCKFSVGEQAHAGSYMSLAQGHYFEMAVNYGDKVTFSTTGAVMHVIQDIDSNVALTSDSLILTSDAINMTYKTRDNGAHNRDGLIVAPVFE